MTEKPARKTRKLLSFLLRLTVTVGLFVYIFSGIQFRDWVYLAGGEVLDGNVTEVEGGLEVRLADGSTRRLKPDDLRSKGAPWEPGLFSIMGRIRFRIALAAFALGCVPLYIDVVRWQILLRAQGVHFTFWTTARLTWIGFFLNSFLLGATGGDVVKAYLVTRRTDRKTAGVLSVFMDRAVGLLALAVMAAAVLATRWGEPELHLVMWIIYGFLGGFAVGCPLYFHPTVRGLRVVRFVVDRLPFHGLLREADEAVRVYRHSVGAMVWSFVLSLGAHLCWCSIALLYGQALGIEGPEWVHYFTYVPVVMVISALPISLGGWGPQEWAYAYFFGLVGVPLTLAVTLSITIKLGAMLWNLPGGLCLLLGDRVRPADVESEMEAGPCSAASE